MSTKNISSRENHVFQTLLRLSKSARERQKAQKTILDGIHLILAYVSSLGAPELVVVSASSCTEAAINRFLNTNSAPVVVFADVLFKAISPVVTPSGILALIRIPEPSLKPGHDESCVILEDIQDPGNLGSILRSAAAAGIKNVYLSQRCVDAWSPKVLRAAMGAHFKTEIQENMDLREIIDRFRGTILATVPTNGVPIFNVDLRHPVAFMLGNEGSGLSEELLDKSGVRITIPMTKEMESLNVAAVAAICFFERVRQLSRK